MKTKYRIRKATRANGNCSYYPQVSYKQWNWLPNWVRPWGSISSYGSEYWMLEFPYGTRDEALEAIEKHKAEMLTSLGNEIISQEYEYL